MQIYQKSILARCPPSPKHPPRCPIPTIFGTCWPIGCASSGWRRGGRKNGLRWSATWTGRTCQPWSARGGTCRCPTSSALRRRSMWSLGCCSGHRKVGSEQSQGIHPVNKEGVMLYSACRKMGDTCLASGLLRALTWQRHGPATISA